MRRFLPFAALLGVALVLGCQDLAPVGPDGLVPQFAVNCQRNPGHWKCAPPPDPDPDPPPPAVGTMFDVNVTSESGDVSFSGVTDPKNGGEIIVDEDMLTLSQAFFDGPLTCSLGAVAQTASLWIAPGEDHVHLFFQFRHNDAKHTLELLGELPGNWPPTAPNNDVTIVPRNEGEWSVSSKGKNHRDACTGSGFGIVWEATVDPK